jgi:threonine synthase
LVCAGCAAEPDPLEPYPFRCKNATTDDDVDHVLRRRLDLSATRFPVGDSEPNPFVRYRGLLHAYHLALLGGLTGDAFCDLVRELDRRVAAVDGRGFAVTPFARSDTLSRRLGFSDRGGVWIKDETRNVAGSHKARHLFGVLLHLAVAERIGLIDPRERRELVIASCGNAALAAAVVAAADDRALRVFVPPDADAAVLGRLETLGARIVFCPRRVGEHGDPTVARLLEAIDDGALPFTCQGNLNGLAVEGGATIGYEVADVVAAGGTGLDRIVVQVGGGALASACVESLAEAVALGVLPASPRVDTVQTEGAWPLKRAYEAVITRIAGGGRTGVRDAVDYAAAHRSAFMWPWEREPRSIAHGILDDETYDWLAVVEGMLATGGRPLVVDEASLSTANTLALETTEIPVDHTGSAGLAGVLALLAGGDLSPEERVVVLFTGAIRSSHTTGRIRDEELSRPRHPVAQGL